MEIYLVRHGQTDYNKKRIIQGRGVNSSINETGRAQAQQFFDHHKHIPFDHVLVYTLVRTQQTLQPFTDFGYELKAFTQLDEINWGIHEGREGSTDLSEEYLYMTERWKKGYLDERIEGGESPMELQARQIDFINNELPHFSGKLLICSHGRAMRSFLCTLTGTPLSQMDEFPHTNLSLYKLNGEPGDNFEIELFNFTGHLKK